MNSKENQSLLLHSISKRFICFVGIHVYQYNYKMVSCTHKARNKSNCFIFFKTKNPTISVRVIMRPLTECRIEQSFFVIDYIDTIEIYIFKMALRIIPFNQKVSYNYAIVLNTFLWKRPSMTAHLQLTFLICDQRLLLLAYVS